jgi:hypothetical protein
MKRFFMTWLVVICGVVGATAQHFYNLTAEEVKIDSLLPYVSYSWPLGTNYADSVYEVSIAYPEFWIWKKPMSNAIKTSQQSLCRNCQQSNNM